MFKAVIGAVVAAAISPLGAAALEITSPDIAPGAKIADEQVFSGFGCSGKNVSPALKWSGAPAGTKSFALMVYDPDAPTGSGFWHWVVADIPPNVTELPKGAGTFKATKTAVGGLQSRTDYGVPGYGGPCPPQGDPPHHYHFMIFAVDTDKLGTDPDTSAAVVGFNLHFHALAKAELVAVYGR
jgi:Raf kinase inhibitor-like YbhB/YbcL family protein